MSALHLATMAVSAGWLLLACLQPYLGPHHRPRAFRALVALGVPTLGWLTLHWGPMLGVAGFALGLVLLFRPPLRRSRDRVLPRLD